MNEVRLRSIHVYPVKSCRGVDLDEASIATTGLEGDRQYQVVDGDGTPVTQRQHAVLATVQPTKIDGGLRLEADGRPAIEVAAPTHNDTTVSSLLGTPVDAGDAGDAAAAWFGELLGAPSRLVALTSESSHRLPVPGVEVETSWADAAPVLVAGAASCEWLASRATEPFGIDRFRPNLVIEGAEPFAEDRWRSFRVGDALVEWGLAWPRCAIPQIDQRSGERHAEPAKVLRARRWCASAPGLDEPLKSLVEGNALFGIACTIGPPGARLAVGDQVQVDATDDPVIPGPPYL